MSIGLAAPAGRHRAEPVVAVGAARPRVRQSAAMLISLTSISALGMLAMFFVTYALGLSALQEQRSQHQLYASFRGLLDPSSPVAPPVSGVIAPGSPVALLNSAAAGLHNVVVVEGTSAGDLTKGPGHLRDSPLPGQVGQSILMGRSLTGGAPFRHVAALQPGDAITVTTGQSTFHFAVSGVRTDGSPLPRVPSGHAVVTLVTSAGSGALGSLAPSHVVYVDATLQGKPVADPPGRPVAVPVSELAGHNDPGSWTAVVFWLQALVLAAIGCVWLAARWGRWQTWLVGAPIIFAVLWGVSGAAMRLLPNVM